MDTLDKEIVDDKLTQADLIKLMLHNAQHMATREEVKADITKVETSLKHDMVKLETTIAKVETSLKQDIAKVDAKFDRMQWLIVATILTIVFKDYILSIIH